MKIIKISSIKQINYDGPVYDLTVDQDHSYNIDRIIVHNSVCSTSVQTAIHASHYWMLQGIKSIQELIKDTKRWKDEGKFDCFKGHYDTDGFITKTIADGGINTLDKAIKCLAIGYDYVMMGKCFAECEEACGEVAVLPEGKFRCYYGMASLKGQEMISGSATKNPEDSYN